MMTSIILIVTHDPFAIVALFVFVVLRMLLETGLGSRRVRGSTGSVALLGDSLCVGLVSHYLVLGQTVPQHTCGIHPLKVDIDGLRQIYKTPSQHL